MTSAVTGRRSNQLSYAAVVSALRLATDRYITAKSPLCKSRRVISEYLHGSAKEKMFVESENSGKTKQRPVAYEGKTFSYATGRYRCGAVLSLTTLRIAGGISRSVSRSRRRCGVPDWPAMHPEADFTMSSTLYCACQPISSLMRFGEPITVRRIACATGR